MMFPHFKFPLLEQWIVIAVGSMTCISAGQAFGWPIAALPKIHNNKAGFQLTTDEESWMVTVVFIGNVLSPIPAGYIMDYFGRKRSMAVLCSTAILPWILLLTIHSAVGLYAARFLTGIWCGSVYTIIPVYLAEMVDPKIRGVAMSLFAVSIYVGCLYVGVIAPYVSYDVLNAVVLFFPIILFFGLLYVPESPYYFIMKGKEEDAKKSLLRVREASVVDSDLARIQVKVKEQMENRSTFVDVVKTRAARKAFVIVIVLGMIQRTGGLSILFTYLTVTIPTSFVSPEMSVIILICVWVVAGAVGVNGVDYFGRKPMFIVSSIGSSIMMAIVSTWFYLRDKTDVDTSSTNWVPLAVFMLHGVTYSLGLISIPPLVQGELFPVNVKAKASALSSINMAFFSGVIVKIFYPIQESAGVYLNFCISSASSFLGLLFGIFVLFETKGKSLEEIQDILESKHKTTS